MNSIALGTWSWGDGPAGADQVFGNLTDKLTETGSRYGLSCSQTAIAWALTKGTAPIIGATKPKHVLEAAKAKDIRLTREEVAALESAADAIDVDTRGEWEHSMEK